MSNWTIGDVNGDVKSYPVWSSVINISSATSVNKDGVSHSMIGSDGSWNIYNLFQVDPSDSDFLNKEYEIIWNSSLPGSWAGDNTGYDYVNHHEGYILDCNGIISQDSLLTGPTWWWYSSGHIESITANWVSYSPGGISVNASREYRTSHSLILKFTSNNTYTLTTNIEGTLKSYSYTSDFNFSEKTSIDFNYKINTNPSVGTIGSHTVTVSEINTSYINAALLRYETTISAGSKSDALPLSTTLSSSTNWTMEIEHEFTSSSTHLICVGNADTERFYFGAATYSSAYNQNIASVYLDRLI